MSENHPNTHAAPSEHPAGRAARCESPLPDAVRANPPRLLMLLASLFALSLAAGPAWAQPADSEPDQTAEQTPAVRDEVDLRVVKVGPGGRTRAADWGGVLVEFRDSALEPREILLRLTGHDRDGDPPAYDRVVVGDPERARGAWLYGLMPDTFATGRISITAHEALEADDGETGTGFRAGRVLGRTWVETRALVPPEAGLYGVVGTRDLGLRQYGVTIQSNVNHLPLGHEQTVVSSGLTVADIPDRWQGLASYGVLVWSRGGSDADPTTLGAEQARAITEWVRRGGHLVIALPPIGQEWLIPDRNPLAGLMPAARIERREGVSYEPYRPLITFDDDATLPETGVVHTMTRLPDAPRVEPMPIINGPGGGCIAMRRAIGTGMVTVVGLDLSAGDLGTSGVLDAEALWHRVLGRRHSLETFDEIKARDPNMESAVQTRTVADYDADIESSIDRRGDSTTGVLLSLVVFGLYWLLAGPLGFGILSKAGKRGHAWIAYVATGLVFTAVAWVGASALRPRKVEATHLTFLTGVHGAGAHHAQGWQSILVPSYGRARIAVGAGEDSGGTPGDDLIAPWTPPPPSGAGGGFPDNRGYSLSARRPDEMSPPVRSTIKQVRVDWAGEPRWSLPSPVGEPGQVGDPALTLVDRENGVVDGVLMHDLPGPLEDVLVVVVAGQRSLPTGSIGPLWLPSFIYMDKPSVASWEPGSRLDLRTVTDNATVSRMQRDGLTWLRDAGKLGKGRGIGAEGLFSGADPAERYTALSFFDMFEVPALKELQGGGRPKPLAARRETHGVDLSCWLTQPCVIVIGHLVQREAGDAPIPLRVDGQDVPSRGRTIVRWVYPLSPQPPGYIEENPPPAGQPGRPGGPDVP